MYNKELPPPFVPQLKSMDDTHLFDDIFTKEPAFDSPIQTPLSHTHQGAFEGFTYTGKGRWFNWKETWNHNIFQKLINLFSRSNYCTGISNGRS